MSMCLDHDLPVRVFDFRTSGNIRRVVKGEPLGTMITKLGGAPISASAPRHA